MTLRSSAPALWAIVPAAGRSERFLPGSTVARRKQYANLLGRPVVAWSLRTLLAEPRINAVVVALASDDDQWFEASAAIYASSTMQRERLLTVSGGASRAQSVLNALQFLESRAASDDWIAVHDAARPCLSARDLRSLIDALTSGVSGAILAVPIADTVKREHEGVGAATVDRSGLWRALTPQIFRYAGLRDALSKALTNGSSPTDEAQAMEAAGVNARLVAGSQFNIKITHAGDLVAAAHILRGSGGEMRIGQGIDVHSYGAGNHIVLGGVRIAHSQGVIAHSDGDVLIHALCDAILGALGRGDIGVHFPDSDPLLRGADSREFLRKTAQLMFEAGYRIENADLTVLAQAPHVGEHRAGIAANLAADMGCDLNRVNVKATTTERLGFIGREQGIAAMAVVCLSPAGLNALSA